MSDADTDEIPDLRDHLLAEVLPFWERHGIDGDHGGYVTHLGRDGAVAKAVEKSLVAQTRMVYSFAVGAELGGPAEWLNLARQGAVFVLQRFRDLEEDGWFWSLSPSGEPRDAAKRTYGHAFAIYTFAEYGRIAQDARALAAAEHTWSLVASRLWDADHGGAIEACDRGWAPTDRGHTMGTHLHVVEALLALGEATGGSHYRPRVRQVCDLLVGPMVEAEHRCGLENFHPDWTRDDAKMSGLANYGHNLEAAWLLLRVDRAEQTPAYRETARAFLDYAVQFGLDTTHGGVFSHGPLGQPATVREKIWWVQTEALVAFLLGYLVFEDRRYWEAFQNVAGFCFRCLHDREYGEWYHSTEEDGTPRDTAKGSSWKSAYHVAQALAYGHQYLGEISGRR